MAGTIGGFLIMLVLDTDHASELVFRSAAGLRLLERLDAAKDDVVITAVTVDEQLRGWLAEINRRKPEDQIVPYARLVHQVEILAAWHVLPWDQDAVSRFSDLNRHKIRIGTQDLKIAAITLAHDAMLLTRNVRDFANVPGLRFENWLR